MDSQTDHLSAIVTGAGSGIGRSTAKLLSNTGYDIVLVGRTLSKLEETAADLAGNSLCVDADIANPAECERIIRQSLDQFSRIDAIANVAGNAPSLPISESTAENWRACIDTNLTAIVHLTAQAWPTFTAQQSGVIVNVSSLASIDPFPGFAMYASAKAGVNMFTKVTAREGEAVGVKAFSVAPGAVETPMLRSLFDESMIPKENTLSPDAIAQVIVDCIIGKRDSDNGHTIQVPNQ